MPIIGTPEAEKVSRDPSTCTRCGAMIYWVTVGERRHPVDRGREMRVVFTNGVWKEAGAYKSHHLSCPGQGGNPRPRG
jgi:hypothetical protein